MKIGKYEIDPTALEMVPESVMRRLCILPLSFTHHCLSVVCAQGEPEMVTQKLQQLAFILNCDVSYCQACGEKAVDQLTLRKIIDVALQAQHTRVSQCVTFEVLCERKWLDLHETADPAVRHCDTCSKSVFWANSGEQAMAYAQLGRCVALADTQSEYIESMGLIDSSYVPPQYGVRLMFQWGRGCLWPLDNETSTVFGDGPIEDQLPLLPETRQRLQVLADWHAQSLNPADPSEPGPWTLKDQADFERAAAETLERVRHDLGDVFTVEFVVL